MERLSHPVVWSASCLGIRRTGQLEGTLFESAHLNQSQSSHKNLRKKFFDFSMTSPGQNPYFQTKLEQLERLRSEDTPRHLMITHTTESCWIPSQNKVEWPWRYRSRSKVITCDTPSHASNHLYQIGKESIQNYRRYRANTIFKVKAEWPWKYRSKSKVITYDTPSNANDDLCQIWKEYKQNCRFFFKVKAKK